MMNDPIVQILREAATRGRQLRLARKQAAQNEARSDNNVAEERLSDLSIGVVTTSPHKDIVKESLT